MQLHSHFLFNTLSAAIVLVRQQKGQKAETMLSRLSDLLRHTLEDVDTQEVPLWRELDFLRLYLSIEQVRFEDRLRVQIDAGPEVSDALVPHMARQPIVENAVRHGLGQSEEPVLIHVSVSKMNGSLKLTVRDDGPGCATPFFGGKEHAESTGAPLWFGGDVFGEKPGSTWSSGHHDRALSYAGRGVR